MKNEMNLYLIPTDKATRLYTDKGILKSGEYEFVVPAIVKNDLINQNIYITNDEEIKEGDYGLALDTNTVFKVSKSDLIGIKKFPHLYKKIILTTDQGLISDGINKLKVVLLN